MILDLFNPQARSKTVKTFVGPIAFDEDGHARIEPDAGILDRFPDLETRFRALGWLLEGATREGVLARLKDRVTTRVKQVVGHNPGLKLEVPDFSWPMLQDKVADVIDKALKGHPQIEELFDKASAIVEKLYSVGQAVQALSEEVKELRVQLEPLFKTTVLTGTIEQTDPPAEEIEAEEEPPKRKPGRPSTKNA